MSGHPLLALDTGGVAFPGGHEGGPQGMSLRDYFAAQVVQICLQASAAHDGCYDYAAAAIGAYEMADAMIAERKG